MVVLEIILLVVLHILVAAALLAIVLGLGGNFILLGLALLVAWIGGFAHLGWILLLFLLVLAVLGEVVEAVLGVLAAKGFGASRWGMAGAFLGGLVGAVLGTAWIPLVGSLIGAVAGAFLGALALEMSRGRGFGESSRAGMGAFLGRIGSTVFKLVIGGLIAWYTLKAAYEMLT